MEEKTLEVLVGELLRRRGMRLSVAESCTGGLIGHRITNVPGSSTYYQGSITAYAYEAKVRLLGIRWETLEKYGAVSQEIALEMARGVRIALAADIGLSVTGIAGPGGGTPQKPVGLTWIGLSAPGEDEAWRYQWQGDRLDVKQQSAEQALRLLADYLDGTGALPDKGGKNQMEPVQVEARFTQQGEVSPLSFTWNERKYLVTDVGRRWKASDGYHILVMTPGEQVFELIFQPTEQRWQLQPPASPKVA
jgi:PncC family amidohydrolase